MPWPDFFVIGAPKAGTTALHAALARHPQRYLSPVKEPKFFLCDGEPPPRWQRRGPGDAHSRLEWVWRQDRYQALFDAAGPGQLRGESTPFYLYDYDAPGRIRAAVPQARLIAVLRDPVDGPTPTGCTCARTGWSRSQTSSPPWPPEPERRRRGWAPFWHYRGLGRYAEQLERLFTRFPREQVHVLRYRELVDRQEETLAGVCAFLGIGSVPAATPSAENVKAFVPVGPHHDRLRRLVRTGAAAGSFLPPQLWRSASTPLLRRLQAGGSVRPPLDPDHRRQAVSLFADDVRALEQLLGRSFQDWVQDTGRGSFAARRAGREG
jgi:hypothetical protein